MRQVRWRKSRGWGCVSSSTHGISSTRWRHLQIYFSVFSLKDLWVLAQVIVIRSQSWRWKYSCDFVGFHVPSIEEYFGSIPSWMIKLQIFWVMEISCVLKYCCDYVDTTFVWHYHLKCIICMMEGNLRYCYVKQVKGLMNYMILMSHKVIRCSGT